MAEPFIKFDVRTEPDMNGFAFATGRFAHRVEDWHPVLEAFGELFKGAMQKQFASEGGAGGGWAPLSAAYAAWKETHFPGPIGVLHGFLRSGMTGGAGYSQHVRKDSADYGLESGPATKYGGFFDQGTDKMPARKVIAFDSGESRRWQKVVHDWMTTLAFENGWK
jgi:hypothetical protein